MSKDVLLLDHYLDRARSNFRLIRLCEWAGFSLSDFTYECVGSGNFTSWTCASPAPKAVLTLGPHAAEHMGIRGHIDDIRGYPHAGIGCHVVPTMAPRWIERGNAKWSAAFINDLQKAVLLARDGMPPQLTRYLLDPRPQEALSWATEFLELLGRGERLHLAFDIETPGKGESEEDADATGDAPDRTWNIERIGFAYRPLEALSIPWAPEYMATIRLLMESYGDKIVWNAGFDCPRIRRAGVNINGQVHDGMVAWHILHSDLPKRLGFVATFTCPWQPAWKHLSGSRPAFYNATDADVELRSWLEIERGLREAHLWDVYQRDVLELEPILLHMTREGMPVDQEIRLDRARKLADKLISIRGELEALTPLAARRIAHVYTNTPKNTEGLLHRESTREMRVCSACGVERPRKDHFKRFVKKSNPCADAHATERTVSVVEYYRLAEFTPSRDQLIRYHQVLGRPCPLVRDGKTRQLKVSFGEEQIKQLMLKYPDDQLYPLILDYRGIDKLAGTYVGRPA